MTEVSRLAQLTATAGNILDKPDLPDVSRTAVRDGRPVPLALTELVDEADGFAKNGQPLDDAWMGTAAAFLARAISDGDAHSVVSAQEVFRRLAGTVHRAADALQTQHEQPSMTDENADRPDTALAREVLAQVNALIEVADAGAGIVRPKGLAARLEPESLPAKILLDLTQDDLVFTDELRTRVPAGVTQLSRACNKLVERGLVAKRLHGRRAAWNLTSAGAATAQVLREAQYGKARDKNTIVATSKKEFATAVHEKVSHIALALGLSPDISLETDGASMRSSCHYLLTNPISADDIETELQRFPTVIFTDDEDVAYVCSDWSGTPSERLTS